MPPARSSCALASGGADPYEVVEIAAAEGFHFGVFTLHRSMCTGTVMPHFR